MQPCCRQSSSRSGPDPIRENGLAASFIPDDVPRGTDFVRLLEEVIGE